MKALINKKVWNLPDAAIESKRTVTEYKCLSNNEHVSTLGGIKGNGFTFNIEVQHNCCTKKLIKYLRKKMNKSKSIPLIIKIGEKDEVSFNLAIHSDGFDSTGLHFFKGEAIGEPIFKELINWDEVENEI